MTHTQENDMDPDTRTLLSTYGLGGLLVVLGFFVLRTSSNMESWTLMVAAVVMLLIGMVRVFAPDGLLRRH